ncbi:hypothetical protein ACHAWO_000315 [Cyclotella atomus]|uniref:Uncharacterized protein n=1 Tax=Cyclotella atomus TaxID=382360 RepID=A0ABD3NX30_9STRA
MEVLSLAVSTVSGEPWHDEDMYVHNATVGTVQEVVDLTAG